MFSVIVHPMVLGFASPQDYGVLLAVAGAGMLAGSLLMSAWGGPRRKVLGIIFFEALSGLGFLLIGLRPWLWMAALGAFIAHLTIAVVYGTNQALWQSKVPPAIQGRAFAVQEMLTRAGAPLAYLLAGPLADGVFEPLGGRLVWLVGFGHGRGTALLVLLLGVIKVGVSLAGYLYPQMRAVEKEAPSAAVSTSMPPAG